MTERVRPTLRVEPTTAVLVRWVDPLAALTPTERGRAATFRFERDRHDYVAGHLLLRECASSYVGRPAASIVLRQRCSACGSDTHGVPSVVGAPGVGVSLAHSRGVVAAVATAGPVGIDVEHLEVREPVDEATLTSVLTPRELDLVRGGSDPALVFLRLWVRKEALIKLGVADLDRLAELDVSRLPASVQTGATPMEDGGWRLIEHLDDHAIAAAVWRDQP